MIDEKLLRTIVADACDDPNQWPDLMQEARIAVWRAEQRDHHSRGFLTGAARYRVWELVRRGEGWTGQPRQRGRTRPPTTAGVDEVDPPDVEVDPALAIDVRAAVRKLPPKQREFVFRRFWLDEGERELRRARVPSSVWYDGRRHDTSARTRLQRELDMVK